MAVTTQTPAPETSAPDKKQAERARGPFRLFFHNQTAYQRRLLLCFLLVSFVLFFIFSMLILAVSDRRYRTELRTLGEQTISQARNTSDELLLNVFRYGLESVTNDSRVTKLMYQSAFDASDAIATQELLKDVQKYNDYVDNIYIVNFKNESVLTKLGRLQLSTFYDPGLIETIQSMPVSSVPMRYLARTATVRSAGGVTSQEKVWTVIFHPSSDGAFVMDVSYDAYTKLLNIPSTSEYLHNYILNGYGQVLVCGDADEFAADKSQSPLLLAVQAQTEREGSFLFTDPDTHTRYTVHYIQNAYLGLTYISTVEETAFGVGNAFFFTLLGLSGLFLVLSLLLSALLAGFVYRPVKNLSAQMNLAAPAAGGDEFAQIRTSYAAMQQKSASLESTAAAYRRAQENKLLLKLLDPQAVTKKYSAEQYEPIASYFTELNYCCVLFNVDSVFTLVEQVEDLGLIKYSITNMMEELAEGHFGIKSVDFGVNQTAYICNFDGFDRAAMLEMLTTVQNVLRQYFHVEVSAAVGTTVEDLDDLPQSTLAAKQAIARRFANGNGQLIFCTDAPAAPLPEPRYPDSEEAQLFQAVRAGDSAEARRQLDAFFDAIRPYRLESIMLYLLQLDLACQRLESANHLDCQALDMSEFYFSASTLDDLKAHFNARLDAVAGSIAQQRESNAEKLIARVNALVAERLCDPNLSVAYLADEVDLSVNYLRNVYKEATGESLSGHITKAKLALICQMLEGTELSIQDISEKLGFTTRNYFFTFFKKHTGMTPKQYRLMRGNMKD